ncbi:MAG TPA: hypothetical protein VNL91_01335 [Thermoanaerobaculia bacterium]|nr:hypothetical protein [Thermoanaerobaculia bacterium]
MISGIAFGRLTSLRFTGAAETESIAAGQISPEGTRHLIIDASTGGPFFGAEAVVTNRSDNESNES